MRLTPAGRRLAAHGRGILAAVTAAELDLAARDEPHGLLQIAGHTTALRELVVPALPALAEAYPAGRIDLYESEPDQTEAVLDDDRIDLGLVWDYPLVPRVWRHRPALLSSAGDGAGGAARLDRAGPDPPSRRPGGAAGRGPTWPGLRRRLRHYRPAELPRMLACNATV